jgi:hypothetical protein
VSKKNPRFLIDIRRKQYTVELCAELKKVALQLKEDNLLVDYSKIDFPTKKKQNHGYQEGIFHTMETQETLHDIMDGRYMSFPEDENPRFNIWTSYDSAPLIFLVIAHALRRINKPLFDEWLSGLEPLTSGDFAGLVAIQIHWGTATKPSGTHCDSFWRMLMHDITINFKRKLNYSENGRKITKTVELECQDGYFSSPMGEHEPVYHQTDENNPSIAAHWSLLVKKESFDSLTSARIEEIRVSIRDKWTTVGPKFVCPTSEDIETSRKELTELKEQRKIKR